MIVFLILFAGLSLAFLLATVIFIQHQRKEWIKAVLAEDAMRQRNKIDPSDTKRLDAHDYWCRRMYGKYYKPKGVVWK